MVCNKEYCEFIFVLTNRKILFQMLTNVPWKIPLVIRYVPMSKEAMNVVVKKDTFLTPMTE